VDVPGAMAVVADLPMVAEEALVMLTGEDSQTGEQR
jgi:hypothetical protein